MNELASLLLVQRARTGFGDPWEGIYKSRRPFFDFVVNGVSLYESLAQVCDFVSVIWVDPPNPTEQILTIHRRLAREPGSASDGRVALYVCPECGDLGC